MKPALRLFLFFAGALGFAAIFGIALYGLPPVGQYRGPYGDRINARAVPERHITDSVTSVNFDFRAFDTLGEEFIFFASIMGVMLLLRKHPDEGLRPPKDEALGRKTPARSTAVRVFCVALTGPIFLFGIYIVTHGQLTPGGGFQGGIILATAILMVYIAGQYEELLKVAPHSVVEIGEAIGAGGYALIGCSAFLSGLPFLTNVLPKGRLHDVFSGGTVAVIDVTVGVEVACGFVLLLLTFLEDALTHGEKPAPEKQREKA